MTETGRGKGGWSPSVPVACPGSPGLTPSTAVCIPPPPSLHLFLYSLLSLHVFTSSHFYPAPPSSSFSLSLCHLMSCLFVLLPRCCAHKHFEFSQDFQLQCITVAVHNKMVKPQPSSSSILLYHLFLPLLLLR